MHCHPLCMFIVLVYIMPVMQTALHAASAMNCRHMVMSAIHRWSNLWPMSLVETCEKKSEDRKGGIVRCCRTANSRRSLESNLQLSGHKRGRETPAKAPAVQAAQMGLENRKQIFMGLGYVIDAGCEIAHLQQVFLEVSLKHFYSQFLKISY